jgi:predicted dehydrogenase
VLIRLRLGMGPMYGGWRDSPAQTGGGLLIEAGVHRIYLALYLFGPSAPSTPSWTCPATKARSSPS